jgi:hypothetical protein
MRSRRDFIKVTGGVAAGLFGGATVSDADAAPKPLVTLLNGEGAPKRRLGTVGDFYINDAGHAIYGPKRTSGWGKPTSLIGRTGATGPRGYSVLHGDGPPTASTGEDNDFYIDTSTTQLYGPRAGGVWGSPVSLTGAANVTAIDGGTL